MVLLVFCFHKSDIYALDFTGGILRKGDSYKAEGDYARAIKTYTKSIKNFPERLNEYYQLGDIYENVLLDYDKAISLYRNAISMGLSPKTREKDKASNIKALKACKVGVERAIEKWFKAIEKPKIPIYVIVIPGKKVRERPEMFSRMVYQTTEFKHEFKLLEIKDDSYKVQIPRGGSGWISGRNVLKIAKKEAEARERSLNGKAALYERFYDLYPKSKYASQAKEGAVRLNYQMAVNEKTSGSYDRFLRKYPESKYSKDAKKKRDDLLFADKHFLNSPSRLTAWIAINPRSPFYQKAKSRLEDLTFAQAKAGNSIPHLKKYVTKYPEGKHLEAATGLIESLSFKKSASTDTIASYNEFVSKFPESKYVEKANANIDKKEFKNLLATSGIEPLEEKLKSEKDRTKVKALREKIEDLYYSKAGDNLNSEEESIKLYEDYLDRYRKKGKYRKEAQEKVEELTFVLALKNNTIPSLQDYIKKYPNGTFLKQAEGQIEEIAFNTAKEENTTKAFKLFIKEYPKSQHVPTARSRIENDYYKNVEDKNTVAAYGDYVKLYPNGSYLDEALLKIDTLIFKPFDEAGTIKSLKKFIKKYPDNRFVEDATERIEELAYAICEKRNTLKAYKKYIEAHPQSPYNADAKDNMRRLQALKASDPGRGFPYLLVIILVCLGVAGWRKDDIYFLCVKVKKHFSHINKEGERTRSSQQSSVTLKDGNTTLEVSHDETKITSSPTTSFDLDQIKTPMVICAIGIFASFFLPWYQMFLFKVSAFTYAAKTSQGVTLFLIPVLSGIIIFRELMCFKKAVSVSMSLVLGAFLIIGIITASIKEPDMYRCMTTGAYLTFGFSAGLIFFSIKSMIDLGKKGGGSLMSRIIILPLLLVVILFTGCQTYNSSGYKTSPTSRTYYSPIYKKEEAMALFIREWGDGAWTYTPTYDFNQKGLYQREKDSKGRWVYKPLEEEQGKFAVSESERNMIGVDEFNALESKRIKEELNKEFEAKKKSSQLKKGE